MDAMLTPVFLCKHIAIAQCHCYKTTTFIVITCLPVVFSLGFVNHFNPCSLFVGKAFAEISSSASSTSLQHAVSLSSGYFLQKAFPTMT